MEVGEGDFVIGGTGLDSFEMELERPETEAWLANFLIELDAAVYHFHHIWNIGGSVIRRLRRARPEANLVLTLHDYTAICANHGQMVRRPSGALCNAASSVDCGSCFADRPVLDLVVRARRLRELLGVFDQLISPSQFLADRHVAWGVEPSRIMVLQNGLPMAHLDSRHVDLDELGRRAYRFSFFGSASPTKGLDVLARAARLLQKKKSDAAQVTINVHGPTEADIAQHFPKLKIPSNMVLRGRYQPDDAIRLMSSVGWIIVPSIWWENAPVVIQEARAAGTPVISSDIGGMAEGVADFGLTFSVGDPSDLAQLIAELAGNVNRLLEHRGLITQPLSIAEYADILDRTLHSGSTRSRASEKARLDHKVA